MCAFAQDADRDTLPANWWTSFQDTVLDSLITIGVDNNYDILMAARRVEIARQTLNQARSLYYPTLELSGGWKQSRAAGTTSSAWSLGIDMSWQVDIFGKVTAQAKNRKAQWRASRIQRDGMMLTIEAKIAATYFSLRTLQGQLEVAREQIASQQKILDIVKARYEAGLNSKLDVAQAQTVYLSTVASVPTIENNISTTMNALAVLTAMDVDRLKAMVSSGSVALPPYDRLLAKEVPSDLLRRRPDIAQAEAVIDADAAALGVAKKDYLPSLSIQGSIGTSAHRMGDMFGKNSLSYSIAPTLSWTIFDGLSRKYAVAEAQEQMQADIDSYNLTVLNALSEANNAFGNYDTALRQIELYAAVANQANEALTLSLDLYTSGLNSYRDVATAQLDYLNYTDRLVGAKGSALAALVAIYEALGGGWNENIN
ncbi:MAG: efflux transporter outer membrane subunit [Muribaculaceae bacterium]|nr:efflux transporter outer membrane subunit [Muribaculaceae bacterium]